MTSAAPAPARTVDDALTVLEAVATARGATLSELSRATGLTTSKTFRLLAALEARGYLERRAGKAYELGPKLLHLGHRAARGHPLVRAAAPVLDRLTERSGESTLLAVRVGLERVIIDSRDGRYGPQMAWPEDARLPLHSGPLGLCLLAYAQRTVVDHVLSAGLRRFTSHTLTSRDALEAALDRVRRDQVYVARHPYVEGVYSVASPILGSDRQAVASIAVVGDVARLDDAAEVSLRALVKEAASDVAGFLT